ncbi:MAG: deaminase [Chloroflexota bacterium]
MAKLHPDNPDNLVQPDDGLWMRLALKQARQAVAGRGAGGAIAVWQGQVIGTGFNRKEATNDPTSHAEMYALQQAAHFAELAVLM